MGNKSNSNNRQLNSYELSKTHILTGGIQKKVHEAKASRVGKRARDVLKRNLGFLLKRGISAHQLLTYYATNDAHSLSSLNSPKTSKLPSNQQEDRQSHHALKESLLKKHALHASPSWQYLASTMGEPRFPPIDALPRTWKESLKPYHHDLYDFTLKQSRYQELIYEVILTEQSYVDDLILVYKIFIKEALQWDGLSLAVRLLFENVFQIIRLHLQLLKEVRATQVAEHPVVHSITDIYRSFITRFGVYASYFSNFEKANNTISDGLKNLDEFGLFVARRSLWPECRNLPLSAYLLKPIQRVMKYPLFFRSLLECLTEHDGETEGIQLFLSEMDIVLRLFEKQKKESEDFIKLEDLAGRISGLEGSTIHLAKHGRKLIHEGYLTIVPEAQQSSAPSEDSDQSFSSSVQPTSLSRRNSTFSIASKRQKRVYVFLFNDLIVCTTEKAKRKPNPSDNKTSTIKKGSFYGPTPDMLFKITHTPGKLTLIDKAVMREILPHGERLSRRGSTLFQSFRRYNARTTEEASSTHDIPLASSYNPSIQKEPMYEKHPLQFVCSIATRHLTNIRFETETPEEKEIWCWHLENVLDEHLQRHVQPPEIEEEEEPFSIDEESAQSPSVSHYSLETASSADSILFSSAWAGYCDVEKMDLDLENMKDKNQEFIDTLLCEFDDNIWSMNAPIGLSPHQLRKTFSNISLGL
ncbi:Dbl homology domain-containing protein [Blakeslea trispora]|nr:Dbl homology domain-containing protein [Blakeslea trispora]